MYYKFGVIIIHPFYYVNVLLLKNKYFTEYTNYITTVQIKVLIYTAETWTRIKISKSKIPTKNVRCEKYKGKVKWDRIRNKILIKERKTDGIPKSLSYNQWGCKHLNPPKYED